jgi:hypothetical protein
MPSFQKSTLILIQTVADIPCSLAVTGQRENYMPKKFFITSIDYAIRNKNFFCHAIFYPLSCVVLRSTARGLSLMRTKRGAFVFPLPIPHLPKIRVRKVRDGKGENSKKPSNKFNLRPCPYFGDLNEINIQTILSYDNCQFTPASS